MQSGWFNSIKQLFYFLIPNISFFLLKALKIDLNV